MTAVRIKDLPKNRRDLAYSIISDARLTSDEDAAIRGAAHDFTEGIGYGLREWVAARRGITHDEAFEVIR